MAPRNTISVLIDADTAKGKAKVAALEAQLKRTGEAGRAVSLGTGKLVPPTKVDADTSRGRARMAELEAQIKRAAEAGRAVTLGAGKLVPLKVTADTTAARAKIEALQGAAGPRRVIPLLVTADTKPAEGKVLALREPAGPRRHIPLIVSADTAPAEAAIDRLKARQKAGMWDMLKAGMGGPPSHWGKGLVAGLGNLGGGVGSLKDAPGLLGLLPGLFGAVATAGKLAFGAIGFAVKNVASLVTGAFSAAITGAKYLLGGLAAAAGLTVAAVYGVVKALQPAAEKEMSVTKWETMLGSLDKAKARFAELEQFNLATPFQTPEINAAATQMQVFGFYSIRNLRAVGDAAAAMQRNIVDAVAPLSRLRAGMFHQEMMAPIGLTRQVLAREGVKFGKSGEMLTPGPQAFDAAIAYFERRFGGMAAKMALTWTGIMSNLADAWHKLWQGLGEGPLERLKPALDQVFQTVAGMAEKVKGFDLPWLDQLTTGLIVAKRLLNDLADPETRGPLLETGMEAVKAVPEFLWGGLKALIGEMGNLFGNLVENLAPAFSLLGDIFVSAWRVGVALFQEAWSSISREARDNLQAAIPGSTGQPARLRLEMGETRAMTKTAEELSKSKSIPEYNIALDIRRGDITGRAQLQERLMGDVQAGMIQPLRAAEILDRQETARRTALGYQRPDGSGVQSPAAEQARMKEQGAGLIERGKALGRAVTRGAGEKLDPWFFGDYRKAAEGEPADAQGYAVDKRGKRLHDPATSAHRKAFGKLEDEIAGRREFGERERQANADRAAEDKAAEAERKRLGSWRKSVLPMLRDAEAEIRQRPTMRYDEESGLMVRDLRAEARQRRDLGALQRRGTRFRTDLKPYIGVTRQKHPAASMADLEDYAEAEKRIRERERAPKGAPAKTAPAPEVEPAPTIPAPRPAGEAAPPVPREALAPAAAAPAAPPPPPRRKTKEEKRIGRALDAFFPILDREEAKLILPALKSAKGLDRLAAAAEKSAAGMAKHDAAALDRQRAELRVPANVKELLAATPAERKEIRRTEEIDVRLKEKMDDLGAGERVHFTPREKRRLGDVGVAVPRPHWAAEQDRQRGPRPEALRPTVPSRPRLEDSRAGLTWRTERFAQHRLGDIGEDRRGRHERFEQHRIKLDREAVGGGAVPAWTSEVLAELRRATAAAGRSAQFEQQAVSVLERLARLEGAVV